MASSSKRPNKRKLVFLSDVEEGEEEGVATTGADDFYRFKVLLPNGAAVGLWIPVDQQVREKRLDEFILFVRGEYYMSLGSSSFSGRWQSLSINWKSPGLFLQDAEDAAIRRRVVLSNFRIGKCHVLRLYDESALVRDFYENMWEITMDADSLNELPIDYTLEAVLAD